MSSHQDKKKKSQFIKLMTHWNRVTKSPSTRVRNWGTLQGSFHLKGSEAAREGGGTGYLEGGGGGEPPHRRGPSTQPGPPQLIEGRGQGLRHGRGRAPLPANAPASPTPGRDGAARTSRPRRGPTGLTRLPAPLACLLLPLPAAPPATPGPQLAVSQRAPGMRARSKRAGRRALTIVNAAPSRPPHFTPLPSGELPALEPRHVTSGRRPHVTPPLLSSPPPAPVFSWSLAPPNWPAWPSEARPFGGGTSYSTPRRGGGVTEMS